MPLRLLFSLFAAIEFYFVPCRFLPYDAAADATPFFAAAMPLYADYAFASPCHLMLLSPILLMPLLLPLLMLAAADADYLRHMPPYYAALTLIFDIATADDYAFADAYCHASRQRHCDAAY